MLFINAWRNFKEAVLLSNTTVMLLTISIVVASTFCYGNISGYMAKSNSIESDVPILIMLRNRCVSSSPKY